MHDRMGLRAIVFAGALGCAGPSSTPQGPGAVPYGFRGNQVWVDGPWADIEPSLNIDDVIDQLCPAIMKLPRATWRDHGQEYCGVIYSLEDGMFYASQPSPLAPTVLVGPSKRKRCQPPLHVMDDRGRPMPWADYHSHPWAPSELSQDDRRSSLQLYDIRIQFDTACTVMKLVPHRHEDRPGEVFVRRGRTWVLTGYIQPEDKPSGRVTSVNE
ncbi:hypothetical protein D7X74_14860 [Corallococcus sp. CA047B]|uniref:hypothetical protein n=1 Tax=Corallococcus sp. CA047B TaxID=2316729 RepID=UPI000EA212C7|nr:hypothetical protein [Corallococcus sp. CA047B]RKH16658.1 hypothetical protein D7X74_14860 [Corallococcus sp. CA047B]